MQRLTSQLNKWPSATAPSTYKWNNDDDTPASESGSDCTSSTGGHRRSSCRRQSSSRSNHLLKPSQRQPHIQSSNSHSSSSSCSSSGQRSQRRNRSSHIHIHPIMARLSRNGLHCMLGSVFIACLLIECSVAGAKADELPLTTLASRRMRRQATAEATTPLSSHDFDTEASEGETTTWLPPTDDESQGSAASTETPQQEDWQPINATTSGHRKGVNGSYADSLILRLARRFSTGNELWDGIIGDCYIKPSFTCFQKNVFTYLDGALDQHDVNLTQRFKFYKNEVQYEPPSQLANESEPNDDGIPNEARSASAPPSESPIEEVTNALYGKSVKFAMTHDLEVQLPDIMFDGATFRISPRSIEGNGIIAKLELIPKQEVQARLAGKIIMKKIQKFLRNKLLLSFLALLLIIKIIKIKLFWLLPLVIGVGAAKKLLLKFLLFLFPALSHLFKLCSYYQQSYHTTKFHHHHHLINHHHTVVPPWHSGEHHSVPEIIYTHPPKGHPSAYLHGAPVHESYGPGPGHEHFEGAWENSGPGLGSEYIGDVNRVAQIEENAQYFKPHTSNDANELHAWGLGTTQMYPKQTQQEPQQQTAPQFQQQQQRWPATQQQRPPITQHKQALQQLQQQQQQQINYQKAHASSHSINPFSSQDKQSSRPNVVYAQSAPSPVYVPPGQGQGHGHGPPPPHSQPQQPGLTAAAQIAAQYEPVRNNQQQQQQQQQQLSPELAAQLKEAIRIQAEQRLIAQQQKILEHQPFVQDGQPLYPLNYDPFYSPILLKIDKIIEQMGIKDDLCKERVVCSMYKDPARYSPHSNFISAELSRDTSELEPVTHANEAVRRFYRLIQAARDGQDQKDCLSLYPQCNIPTK